MVKIGQKTLDIIYGHSSKPIKNRKIRSTQKSTSKIFPYLPKQFQDKSIAEIYEGYCQFLLGASKECIKQYIKFKKGRLQVEPTLSSKSYTAPATLSPTSSHPSTTKTEKMHGRLEKYLELFRNLALRACI